MNYFHAVVRGVGGWRAPARRKRKKDKKDKKTKDKINKKKLTIFMQQLQYNAPNCMHVFQKIFGVTPPDLIWVL